MDTSARTRVQGRLSLTDDPLEYKEDMKPPFDQEKDIIKRNKNAEAEEAYPR
jgi:uncharacterized Fe-S cluster-containing protein